MKVSSADFIKNYGTLADRTFQEPVTITTNGRDRLVVKLEDFTEEEMALIEATEPAPEDAVLEEEVRGWKP
jgi:hypothetical protein